MPYTGVKCLHGVGVRFLLKLGRLKVMDITAKPYVARELMLVKVRGRAWGGVGRGGEGALYWSYMLARGWGPFSAETG